MSAKHERTLATVFEEPTRANILWRDIVSMLVHYGCQMFEAEGSRVEFRLGRRRAVFHRPHPQKEAKPRTVRNVRAFLSAAGIEP
jgi:HicA-like toxin of HicAB toxin-antitoxin system